MDLGMARVYASNVMDALEFSHLTLALMSLSFSLFLSLNT